jgi:hypothetical protein
LWRGEGAGEPGGRRQGREEGSEGSEGIGGIEGREGREGRGQVLFLENEILVVECRSGDGEGR